MCATIMMSGLLGGLALSAQPASAGTNVNNLVWGDESYQAVNNIGLSTKDPREIIAQVIRIALGFLGIIAVIIILLGGFKWMTSGGNEEKAGDARKLMTAGLIGLIIVLAAFGIASFVLRSLGESL